MDLHERDHLKVEDRENAAVITADTAVVHVVPSVFRDGSALLTTCLSLRS
ncbi:MAG: hypothetical protein JW860_06090 [Sedimentisphaerales bacterium]|nr:hypothetical protein [Sedimentisphaerales bacterium]